MQFTSRPIEDAELEHLYGGKVPSKLDKPKDDLLKYVMIFIGVASLIWLMW